MRAGVAVSILVVAGSTAAIAQSSNWDICGRDNQNIPRNQQIAACTAIIESNSERPVNLSRAFYNRGIAYDEAQQYSRAIDDYTQAIRLYPRDADYFVNRGAAYGGIGEIDKALQDFETAIRINPDNATAYCNRGAIKLDRGDTEAGNADISSARLRGKDCSLD